MDVARLDFDSASRNIPLGLRCRQLRGCQRPDDVWVTSVSARHRIFGRADPSDWVYEVSDGAAMITQGDSDDRRQIIDIVGARRLFGFSRRASRDSSAITLSPCILTAYRLGEVAWESPLAPRFARAMADEIGRMRDHVVLLGQKSAMARVAGFLCGLLFDPKALRSKAIVPLSRAEIADFLGLTNETVSRSIAKMKRLRVLGPEDGDAIVVPDVRRLRAAARGEEVDA